MAKLLDFGLVRIAGPNHADTRLTQEHVIAGTPAYASPEQAAGSEAVDARSDIYALGAVAYFLLAGQPPFVRPGVVQVLAAHIGEPVGPLASFRTDVPPDLEAVVLRCLEKEPDKRFQDAEALEQALKQCTCARGWTRQKAAAWWKMHVLN